MSWAASSIIFMASRFKGVSAQSNNGEALEVRERDAAAEDDDDEDETVSSGDESEDESEGESEGGSEVDEREKKKEAPVEKTAGPSMTLADQASLETAILGRDNMIVKRLRPHLTATLAGLTSPGALHVWKFPEHLAEEVFGSRTRSDFTLHEILPDRGGDVTRAMLRAISLMDMRNTLPFPVDVLFKVSGDNDARRSNCFNSSGLRILDTIYPTGPTGVYCPEGRRVVFPEINCNITDIVTRMGRTELDRISEEDTGDPHIRHSHEWKGDTRHHFVAVCQKNPLYQYMCMTSDVEERRGWRAVDYSDMPGVKFTLITGQRYKKFVRALRRERKNAPIYINLAQGLEIVFIPDVHSILDTASPTDITASAAEEPIALWTAAKTALPGLGMTAEQVSAECSRVNCVSFCMQIEYQLSRKEGTSTTEKKHVRVRTAHPAPPPPLASSSSAGSRREKGKFNK